MTSSFEIAPALKCRLLSGEQLLYLRQLPQIIQVEQHNRLHHSTFLAVFPFIPYRFVYPAALSAGPGLFENHKDELVVFSAGSEGGSDADGSPGADWDS